MGGAALDLLEGATELLVAKGRKVERFGLARSRPPDSGLLDMLLGRSGKLRAPAMRVGGVVAVGYNQAMLESLFGMPAG